jgi:ubiquinone/menaquinone biosynthesis C-methylase UbiE
MNKEEKRKALRAYYEAEGNQDYQASLYHEGDWIHQRLKQVVLDQVKTYCQGDTWLLDAGCAEGLYLRTVQQQLKKGVGFDLSYPKLVRGRSLASLYHHLYFGVASLEEIPCPSSSFGVALCVETLEHVPDHRLAIGELFRVLKEGGVLVVSVPTEKNELGGKYKLDLDWQEKSGHLHSFSRSEFAALLEQAGFEVQKQVTIDVLGGRLRFALVSNPIWLGARAIWRAWAGRARRPRSNGAAEPVVNRPSVTAGWWQRLDEWLTRLPGLRRWSSLAVWVCVKPHS